MLNRRDKKSVLIVNNPNVLTKNNFYRNVFKVPEVLNRLRQYREWLYKSNIDVPLWVYCITQDIKTLEKRPQVEIVNFLVNLGFFDRLLARQGWPHFLLGPKIVSSIISKESSFDKQASFLTENKNFKIKDDDFVVLKIDSFYSTKTNSYHLTKMTTQLTSNNLIECVEYIKNNIPEDKNYYFLSPHENSILDALISMDIYPKNFLESDQDLKWLWPDWQRAQMNTLSYKDSETLLN